MSITIPDNIDPRSLSNTVANMGRAKNFQQFPVQYNFWEPLMAWLRNLQWTSTAETRTQSSPAYRKITWIEMAIAFEANTAHPIGLPMHDLRDKANIMHAAISSLAHMHTSQQGGEYSMGAGALSHVVADSAANLARGKEARGSD